MKIALIRPYSSEIIFNEKYLNAAYKFNATFEKTMGTGWNKGSLSIITYVEINTMEDLIRLEKEIDKEIILEENSNKDYIKGDYVLLIYDDYLE